MTLDEACKNPRQGWKPLMLRINHTKEMREALREVADALMGIKPKSMEE